MAEVDKCPQNLTGVIEASRKLGCGIDQYGNNQYLCLPNVEKTSLVEFCYKGTMGYVEKGHCVQTFGGNLTFKSCSQFPSGCPEYEFMSTEFYRYAACQDLNLKYNCYTFDPHCPPQNIEHTNVRVILTGVIVGLILLVTISLSSYLLWKRRKKRKGREAQEKQDEEQPLSPAKRGKKTQGKQDEEQPLSPARIGEREQNSADKEELLSTDKTGEREQKSGDNDELLSTNKTETQMIQSEREPNNPNPEQLRQRRDSLLNQLKFLEEQGITSGPSLKQINEQIEKLKKQCATLNIPW